MSSEYEHWKSIFLSRQFQTFFLKLSKKLKCRKVILYGNGIFFDAFIDCCNVKQYLNVIGISDIRYEIKDYTSYKNFNCLKPSQIKNIDVDVIVITSPNPQSIKKYLIQNNICSLNVDIVALLQKERLNNFLEKLKIFFQYLSQTKKIFKAIKYLFFCSKSEFNTKLNYEKKLKKMKHQKKYKVAFVCEENAKWGYQFVYELMKKDRRFEVLPIILFPIVTKERQEFTQKENKFFFDSLNIETIDGYDYEKDANKSLISFEPDLVFYQQPWYLQGQNHPEKVSEYALTMMIPYGFTILSEKHWGSDSVKDVYCNLWMFFSESCYHNKFYEKAANMKFKDNLFACGAPKMEYYRTPLKIEEYEKNIWKQTNGSNKIIWAPHHSIGNDGLKMGNFIQHYNFFLEFAKNHNEYSFVFKPHPALKSKCISSGFMTSYQYDKYISSWKNLTNATVYDKGNYFDLFQSSNVLITDCSSFLAEYFPTKNPIIFLNKSSRAPFDKLGQDIRQAFYQIDNINHLETILYKLLVKKQDNLKNLRNTLIKKHFSFLNSSTSKKIVDFILKNINS